MTEDFWDWLPKAYGDVGDEPTFTKYDMEVAFAAGAEAEAKRMWVGLTDEEIKKMRHLIDWTNAHTYVNFARAIEAALKGKNT